MGVRHKLNIAFLNGAFIFGLIAGASTRSVAVGFCFFAALVGLGIYGGDIRLSPRSRKE
jgi:hypothetical protein